VWHTSSSSNRIVDEYNVVVNSAVYWGFFTDLASFPTTNFIKEGIKIKQCLITDTLIKWWFDFLIEIESRGKIPVLEACICGYTTLTIKYMNECNSTSKNDDRQSSSNEQSNMKLKVIQLHQKFTTSYSRTFLSEEFIRLAITALLPHHHHHPTKSSTSYAETSSTTSLELLSSLMSVTIISAPLNSQSQREEATTFLQFLMMECRRFIIDQSISLQSTNDVTTKKLASTHALKLIDWLMKSFQLFLTSSSSQTNRNHLDAALALGYEFSQSILEFTSITIHCKLVDCQTPQVMNIVSKSMTIILEHMFSMYFIPHTRITTFRIFPIEPIARGMNGILNSCATDSRGKKTILPRIQVSQSSIILLAIACLELGNENDVNLLLQMMVYLVDGYDRHSLHGSVVWGVIHSVVCIFGNNLLHESQVDHLLDVTNSVMNDYRQPYTINTTNTSKDENNMSHSPRHFMELFTVCRNADEKRQLLQSITRSDLKDDSTGMMPCFISGQSEAMLLGLSMLSLSIATNTYAEENQKEFDAAMKYMRGFLQEYPHMGRRCLPVLMALVNKLVSNPDIDATSRMTSILQLLCSEMASDTSCAHAIWSILSSMMVPNASIKGKCMSLRLYPLLCKSNERLYGRIVDSIATFISDESVELRTATALTICDLAKDDLIRDVSDIIGWVQHFLTDEDSLVVSYALLSLHFLIVNGDLDYALVVKVLKKRLVDINDVDAILQLDDIVIESLMKLLGDGDCEIDDSDSDDEAQILPQVHSSVEALIKTSLSDQFLWNKSDGSVPTKFHLRSRMSILTSIHRSLAGYSFSILGIDEEVIRSSVTSSDRPTEDQIRFINLKKVAMDGFDYLKAGEDDREIISAFDHELRKYSSKIISFEEESLGPSLWKKKKSTYHTSSSSSKQPSKIQSSILKALPDFNGVYRRYKDDPSAALALGCLNCFQGSTFSDVTSVLDVLVELVSDMGDVLSGHDPFYFVLAINGMKNAMSKVWQLISVSDNEEKEAIVDKVINDISQWTDELDDNGPVYLAISALVLAIPDNMSRQFDYAKEVIFKAYDALEFDNVNVACVTIALLMVKSVLCSSFEAIDHVIITIMNEIKKSSETGNLCIGGVYSLALIAQSLASSQSAMKREDTRSNIRDICSALILEFHNTIDCECNVLTQIASDFQNGTISENLIDECNKIEEGDLNIRYGCELEMIALSICISLVMSAMVQLHKDIIKVLLSFSQRMSWGSGKGILLASCCRMGRMMELLTKDEIEKIESHCSESIHQGSDCLEFKDGSLFAMLEVNNQLVYDWCKQILQNNDNYASSTRVCAVIAACKTIGTIPPIFGESGITQLRVNVRRKNIEETKVVLQALADNSEEDSVSKIAAVCLGVLSCMKYQTDLGDDGATTYQPTERPRKVVQDLPEGSNGTLTASIVDRISKLQGSDLTQSSVILAPMIASLQEVSLPASFAKILDSYVQKENSNVEALKITSIEVLMKQASMARRAADERREFSRISMIWAKLPASEFNSSLSYCLVSHFPPIFSQIASSLVEGIFDSLWLMCCRQDSLVESIRCIQIFLQNLYHLLEENSKGECAKHNKLAPTVLSGIRKRLILKIFKSLSTLAKEVDQNSDRDYILVRNDYFRCLLRIPINFLDEHDFFSFQSQDQCQNILRAHAIAFLQNHRAFGSQGFTQVLKAQSWIARQCLEWSKSEKAIYWITGLHLGRCGTIIPDSLKVEFINSMLDILLVSDNNQPCLDALAIQVAVWHHHTTKETLQVLHLSSRLINDLSLFLLKNLPQYLGRLSNKLRMKELVMNRLMHVAHTKTSLSSDERNEYEDCLNEIIICCRQDGKIESHASFISNILKAT